MYHITSYDIINGDRTNHRILKTVEVLSIHEIDRYQAKLQRRIQRLHSEPINVLCNYKVPIPQHAPWI